VAPVPPPLLVRQPAHHRAERLGGKHLLGGGVEEGDILRLGVEGIPDQLVSDWRG
jgi:hypothetical protein